MTNIKRWLKTLGAVSVFSMAAGAASADSADGVLRVALVSPVEAVDIYMGPGPETAMTTSAVFNPLVAYQPDSKEYVGVIAESWTRVDDTTVEFKVKPGLVFQDGSALNAEDVTYTINFISNPEKRFRLKSRYDQFAGAEQVDNLTVRISTRGPFPMLMARLIGVPIFPSDSHSKLGDDFASWGRAPIGSGPYRVVGFDDSTGIVMERWDGYQLGPLPEFKKIIFRPLPDVQTQIAEMAVGGLDLIVARSPEQIAALTAMPGVKVSTIEDMFYQYIYLDALGRSGIDAFKDIRVRKAMFHAIDRDAIRTSIIAGGFNASDLNRLCFPLQVGCPSGGQPLSYDPKKARELLAEAGYADGFDLQVSTWGPSRAVAEAVVGYLRGVGVRAKLDVLTAGAYRKKQPQGELQSLVSNYSYGGLPDSGAVLDFFFGSPSRDYFGNARLTELTKEVNSILDEDKRAELFREAFQILEDEALILPISKDPTVIIHTDAVNVDTSKRGDIAFARLGFFESYGDIPAILGWVD